MKANSIGMEDRTSGADAAIETERDLRHEYATLRERVLVLEDEKRELQSFAALAAHELLEPIIMADACAQMVLDRLPDEDPDSIEDLLALTRGLARARILVESLLQETAAPAAPLAKQPVNLDLVLRDTLELLRPEVLARKAKVQTQRLPVVEGDAALLSALLKNLIINALKYGPRTNGKIAVTCERTDGWVRVSVASDGPPIPAANRQAVFQPFRRGYGERRARGTGLGLAICQRIVERHAGRIELSPGKGESGNVFTFSLPD
jgi:signal transduction histidine kinase